MKIAFLPGEALPAELRDEAGEGVSQPLSLGLT